MLEQLVESKNNASENKRRFGFLTTTLFTVGFVFLAALTYSLFAKDLGANDDGLELSSLVAPVPIANEPPPQPEVKPQPPTQNAPANPSSQITRREMFESVNSATKPPKETGGQQDVQSWMKGAKIGEINFTPPSGNPNSRNTDSVGTGIADSNPPMSETTEAAPEPKKMQPKVEPPKEVKKPTMISEGVVNGKATNLVKPAYPLPAKAVRAAGAVNVQVVIDEKGNVISATAVSGHQLLRQAAEQSARASKFSPTFLSKVPVKVTGVIVYNFVAQ